MTFDLGEQLLFERQILKDRLHDVIDTANGVAEIDTRPHARNGRFIVTDIAQIGGDARFQAVQIFHDRVGDGHFVTGKGEDLRDAMAHQPGADHGDFCFAHDTTLVLGSGGAAAISDGRNLNYPAV